MEALDKSQSTFCSNSSSCVRLLAPAGCGKTLSLLFRCKHFVEAAKKGRERCLIVTFTVAAKQELQSRLNEDNRFGSVRDLIEISTLNSWGFRRIKNTAFSPKLITSKADFHFAMLNQLQPVWKNHEAVRLAIEQKRNIAPRKLLLVMDAFKSIGFDHVRHVDFDHFSRHLTRLREQHLGWRVTEQIDELIKLGVLNSTSLVKGIEIPQVSDRDLYERFYAFWIEATEHLIANATFTLEDQKYFAYLDERKKVEEGSYLTGAARYDHVLVDEFQDINPLDLALIKAITTRSRSTVTIVGDDDQAIFEWRGATPEYILNPDLFFEAEFDTCTLATNYRSPRNIVERSQRLIAYNTRRVEKNVSAFRTTDAQIEIIQTEGIDDALERVYEEVKQAIGKGNSPSRVAIIGRKRSQIIPYQVYFASKDVSFCAAEDLQVFMSDAFERLLKLLMTKERSKIRQLRSQSIEDLLELCNLVKRYPLSRSDRDNLKRSLQQASPSSLEAAVSALAEYKGPLKGTNVEGAMSRLMAEAIEAFLNATSISEALVRLSTHFEGLQVDLGKAEDDIFYTDPPFAQLAEYAASYGNDYGRFLDDIERAKNQLAYLPPFEDDSVNASSVELWKRPLHLMTALRAKGKEFDCVILLDVNDGIWPNRNARTPEQLEAERRVFYVAFTRAKHRLLMLVSKRIGSKKALQSPYIAELGLSVD